MIVFQKSGDDPFEVGFIQHDDVVQALAAESADPALDEGVLPGTLWGDEHFLDTQVRDALPEDRAVAAVTVADQVPCRLVKGKAGTTCWATHAAVGWVVTLTWTTRRRSWRRTMKQ